MMRPDPSRVNAQTSKAVQMRLSSYKADEKLITMGILRRRANRRG
jgi:hypothetical protein